MTFNYKYLENFDNYFAGLLAKEFDTSALDRTQYSQYRKFWNGKR